MKAVAEALPIPAPLRASKSSSSEPTPQVCVQDQTGAHQWDVEALGVRVHKPVVKQLALADSGLRCRSRARMRSWDAFRLAAAGGRHHAGGRRR